MEDLALNSEVWRGNSEAGRKHRLPTLPSAAGVGSRGSPDPVPVQESSGISFLEHLGDS